MFPCCRPAQTELLFSHRPTRTFDAEGEILEHPLTKSFRMRNDAIKGLCSSVRRFGKSTMNLQKFDGGWKIIASHTSIDDVIGLPRTNGSIPKHRPDNSAVTEVATVVTGSRYVLQAGDTCII
jgi:hypothetical protein